MREEISSRLLCSVDRILKKKRSTTDMEENGFVNMQSQEVLEVRLKQDTLGYRNAKTERFVFATWWHVLS